MGVGEVVFRPIRSGSKFVARPPFHCSRGSNGPYPAAAESCSKMARLIAWPVRSGDMHHFHQLGSAKKESYWEI